MLDRVTSRWERSATRDCRRHREVEI